MHLAAHQTFFTEAPEADVSDSLDDRVVISGVGDFDGLFFGSLSEW